MHLCVIFPVSLHTILGIVLLPRPHKIWAQKASTKIGIKPTCIQGWYTHTLDLMPKNLMKIPTIADVMGEAKEMYNFSIPHHVNISCAGIVWDGNIDKRTTMKNVTETRMILTEIHLSLAFKHSKCLDVISENPEWMRYYSERSHDTKAQIDQFL